MSCLLLLLSLLTLRLCFVKLECGVDCGLCPCLAEPDCLPHENALASVFLAASISVGVLACPGAPLSQELIVFLCLCLSLPLPLCRRLWLFAWSYMSLPVPVPLLTLSSPSPSPSLWRYVTPRLASDKGALPNSASTWPTARPQGGSSSSW